MSINPECSSQTLGLFLCSLLVAYIFYSLRTAFQSHSTQSERNNQTNKSVSSTSMHLASADLPYDRGFIDGTNAYLKFDIHDIRRLKHQWEDEREEMKIRLKSMNEKLDAFEKRCMEMEKLFDDRNVEMEGWKDGKLRMIWEDKQKSEKGLGGWLKR